MTSTGDYSDAAKDAFLADKSLYIGDVKEDTPPGCIFDKEAGEAPDTVYLDWVFACVRDNLSDIDKAIEKASVSWSVTRMNTMDLAIMRVAAAEILYVDGVDKSVSANEAVLIAKKYASERSPSFINGILGTITRGSSCGGNGEGGGNAGNGEASA